MSDEPSNAASEFHRNELTARVGTDVARLRTTYVRYDGQPQNNLQSSEEMQYGLDTQLTRLWRSQLFGITDIKADKQRQVGVRAIYEDECMLFSAEVARDQFKDGDFKPQTKVFFRVGFKTLGAVSGGRNAFGG